MGKTCVKKYDGIQVDIYGNPVCELVEKAIFRTVKCGKCGDTVKSSQAKLHISYGKKLNICKTCLEEMDKRVGGGINRGVNREKQIYGIGGADDTSGTGGICITNSQKLGPTIESYAIS